MEFIEHVVRTIDWIEGKVNELVEIGKVPHHLIDRVNGSIGALNILIGPVPQFQKEYERLAALRVKLDAIEVIY